MKGNSFSLGISSCFEVLTLEVRIQLNLYHLGYWEAFEYKWSKDPSAMAARGQYAASLTPCQAEQVFNA